MQATDLFTSTRRYFISLFILFGSLIAVATSVVDYRLTALSIENRIENEAQVVYEEKQSLIKSYTSQLENILTSLRDSRLFYSYLNDPTEKNHDAAISLFYSVTYANPQLSQARYINENGFEEIRINWQAGRQRPNISDPKNLQDKSRRYYFHEASNLLPGAIWFSKLDLNVENDQIEIPYTPTLRVATPIYIEHRFRGIVIINCDASEFLANYARNTTFYVGMIDQDGYYMVSNQRERSWSRYLNSGHTIQTTSPQYSAAILQLDKNYKIAKFGDTFAGTLAPFLEPDGAILILQVKDNVAEETEREHRNTSFLIIAAIMLLSFPLSWLISKAPTRFHGKISAQNSVLRKYFEIIDKNVHTCTLKKDGIISECSSAFVNAIGIPASRLIGTPYSSLFYPHHSQEYYDELWLCLRNGLNWAGELQLVTGDNNFYWADVTIIPREDRLGNITTFSVIHQDITDKKRIEALSIKDGLTDLYNRRYFSMMIARELNRALRDKKTLSFAMLDVDFFKQYNDHYGHQKGDDALKALAQVLNHKLARASDYAFRLGGEEFGILFLNTDYSSALRFAEQIREAVYNIGIEHKWSSTADVLTVSIGLISVSPGPGVTEDTIYRLADKALYRAKEEGRNRVVARELSPII